MKVGPDRVGILFEDDFPRKAEMILRDTLNLDVSISCTDNGFLKSYEVSNGPSRTIRFDMDPCYFYDFDTEDDLFKFWFYRFKELMSVGSYCSQAVQVWDEEVNAPVKDRNTVPWMSATEIPAVKLVLSEWRRLRRERNSNHYPHVGSASLERYVKDAATLLNYVAVSEKKLKEEMEK